VLEIHIRNRLKERPVLLMTHIVIGYPTLKTSLELIDTMVAAGVDLMELQIPFSEPIADGPVILKANQQALANGTRVADCFKVAADAATGHSIPFLFMTYYNILHRFGVPAFVDKMASCGLSGAIVPDLPPEESQAYQAAMEAHQLAPVYIFAPTTADERMRYIAQYGRGMIYCVARKGVTGQATDFSKDLGSYLGRCRAATNLPLALGFGVKDAADVAFLTGKADIAVVGTQCLRILEEKGVAAVGDFIRDMRP